MMETVFYQILSLVSLSLGMFALGWIANDHFAKRNVSVTITAHVDSEHNRMMVYDAQWKEVK